MAGFAAIGRWGVLEAFSAGNRTVVAARTLPRRTPEAAVDVAGSAVDAEMRARKRKARRKMIKRGASPLRLRRRNKERRDHQSDERPQAPGPEDSPSNLSDFIAHPLCPHFTISGPRRPTFSFRLALRFSRARQTQTKRARSRSVRLLDLCRRVFLLGSPAASHLLGNGQLRIRLTCTFESYIESPRFGPCGSRHHDFGELT